MAQTYRTRAGDTVDWIAYQQYGSGDQAYIALILDANAGLAAKGPVLDAGLAITLPDAGNTTTQAAVDAVTLWA